MYWEIATFLVAGDMRVFHRTEAACAGKKDCQKSFTVTENLRKEKNKTKERTRNWVTELKINYSSSQGGSRMLWGKLQEAPMQTALKRKTQL